ncbi:MAG: F0F1 ATP synthase subunit delta [Candidatus Omnitrophica bacterium]|nr:F0F1 ATP synthase subunit delta [Candidatus Omnitrophota bacterium]
MAQLIIIQVITFLGLVFVLRKIMQSASYQEAGRLQQLSRDSAKKSMELASRIEQAEKQIVEKIQSAQDQAGQLKEQAMQETQQLKEETLNKARQESDRIIQQALNTKEKVREEIQGRMEQTSVAKAVMLIAAVLSSKNLSLVHQGLMQEILEEMERIDASQLQINTDQGQLIAPVAVDGADKQKITATLSKKTGRNIVLEDVINKDLVAGISIKLGSIVIDGSLAEKLRKAASRLGA